MEDNKFVFCRLCLKIIRDSGCKLLENIELDMLDMLAPMNMCISSGSAMCKICHEKLLACHEFKTMCFEMDNRRNTLKEEMLYTDNIKPTNIKLCSLCFQNVDDDMLKIFLGVRDTLLTLMLEKCLPELDVHRMDTTACSKCFKSLEVMFSFINECQITEEKVDKFCIAKNINKQNGLRLLDVILFFQSYSVDVDHTLFENSLVSSIYSNVISAGELFIPRFELESGRDGFKDAEINEETLMNDFIRINPAAPQVSNLNSSNYSQFISLSDFFHPEVKLEPAEDNREFIGNNEESYLNVGSENCDDNNHNIELAQTNNQLISSNFNYDKVKLESDQDVIGELPFTENFQRIVVKEEPDDTEVKLLLPLSQYFITPSQGFVRNNKDVEREEHREVKIEEELLPLGSCQEISALAMPDLINLSQALRKQQISPDLDGRSDKKITDNTQVKDNLISPNYKETCVDLEPNINEVERNEQNAMEGCLLPSSSSRDFIAPRREFMKNNKDVRRDELRGNLNLALRTQQKNQDLNGSPDKKKKKIDNTQIKNDSISLNYDEVNSISGSERPIVKQDSSVFTDFERYRNQHQLMDNKLPERLLQVGLKRRNWSPELMAELQTFRPKGFSPYRRFAYRMRTGDGRSFRVRIPPLYKINRKVENIQAKVEETRKADLKPENVNVFNSKSKKICVDLKENINESAQSKEINGTEGCSSSQHFIAPGSGFIKNNQHAKINEQNGKESDEGFLTSDSGQNFSALAMSDLNNLSQALQRQLEDESKHIETSEGKISHSSSSQDLCAYSNGFINTEPNNLSVKVLDSLSMHTRLVERLQRAGLNSSNWSPALMAQVQALRPNGSSPDRWITYRMRKVDGSRFRVPILNEFHSSNQNVNVEKTDVSTRAMPDFVNLNQTL